MILDSNAKIFYLIGIFFIVLGLGWQFGWIQNLRLGHLPGDISIKKENMSFYFPITTGILLSVVITIVSWLFKKL